MLEMNELKDFDKYSADLKVEMIKSKTKIVPFRFFFDFPFNGSKDDILLVGKTPPAMIKDVKKLASGLKLEGDCQLADNQFFMKVENGSAKVERVQKLLKAAKIKFQAQIVEEFANGAQEAQDDFDKKAALRRLASITERISKINAYIADKSELAPVLSTLKHVQKLLKDGGTTVGPRPDEFLDRAERAFIPVERQAQIARKIAGEAPEADGKFGNQKAETQRELEGLEGALLRAEAASRTAEEEGQTALTKILAARDIAIKWQKLEMEKMLANTDQFHKLQEKFRIDERQMETDIKNAQDALDLAKKANAELYKLIQSGTLGSNEKKRKEKDYSKQSGETVKAEKALEALGAALRKLRSDFSTARAKVSDGDKHGTARHGTHTGMEQQALRAAAGGTSADQDDNEWGDSRDKPQPELSSTQGADPNKVRWTMGGKDVELVYEDLPTGERVLKNKDAVLKTFNDIAEELESRGAKTSTSSNFLSPELEKEAVDRGLQVARQCVWDEMWDEQKKDWVPIDRFFVYVGPPKTVRSKGWGHSISRNKDESGNNIPKMKLVEANKILNAFRNGKVDLDQMMKLMKVSLEKSEDGGAILQPVARIMIDRSGSGWTNTSQYPTSDKPGWSLKGAKVRKSREGGDGITAPEATGV